MLEIEKAHEDHLREREDRTKEIRLKSALRVNIGFELNRTSNTRDTKDTEDTTVQPMAANLAPKKDIFVRFVNHC